MSDVLEKITDMVAPLLEGSDMFIVRVKIKPVNNIKLYIDADSGLSIQKSAEVNRKLYALIEEAQLFPDGDFSLEVSSPGVDEPLVSERQYRKNIGRTLLVTQEEGPELLGILKAVQEEGILLERQPEKKKKSKDQNSEPAEVVIPFSNIKKAIVQISF
jgi:ribosome maturation factor RimP